MNNKGFAITAIIYGLMIIFILIFTSFLSIIISKSRKLVELEDSVYSSLNYTKVTVDFSNSDLNDAYKTTKRSLYEFTNYDSNLSCTVYLPKNIVVITGSIMRNDNSKLYYYDGSLGYDASVTTNTNNYKELICMN